MTKNVKTKTKRCWFGRHDPGVCLDEYDPWGWLPVRCKRCGKLMGETRADGEYIRY